MTKPRVRLMVGDCLVRLKKIPDNTFATIITDPPYGLSEEPDAAEVLEHWLNDEDYKHASTGFMHADWDSFVPGPLVWREALRVLKPGGSALVFGGTRTVDLLTVALRLAGFSIRDQLTWLYGSGMPHGLDISKAIDEAAGAEREVVGLSGRAIAKDPGATAYLGTATFAESAEAREKSRWLTAPATPEAQLWDGWHTQLKPAHEPIVWAMKPTDGNFTENALEHGVAGANVDGCRIQTGGLQSMVYPQNRDDPVTMNCAVDGSIRGPIPYDGSKGRFPANVVLDETAAELLDQQAGLTQSARSTKLHEAYEGDSLTPYLRGNSHPGNQHGDAGGVSRFFYTAKASRWERDAGVTKGRNRHPTLKPISLMRYCVRLTATPKRSAVLDPFMGSGSTGVACMLENRHFCGIDLEREHVAVAKQRIAYAKEQPEMFSETEPNRQDRKPRPEERPKSPGLWGDNRR